MPTEVICTQMDGGVRCLVKGELDLTSEAGVLQELLAALDARPARLILDLSAVEFIDSTGLRTLLTCRNRANDINTRLVLTKVGAAVRRLFDVAKVGDWFEYTDEERPA